MLKKLLESIVTKLVDEPDKVTIDESQTDAQVLLKLAVASSDLGKVIGKEGKTARAIRTILSVAGASVGKKVALEIAK